MRAGCLVLAMLLAVSVGAPLRAQSSNGYFFVAPGGVTCCGHTQMTLQMGLGGEGILGKGIGIGAELGALAPRKSLVFDAMGVLSVNGYYHFIRHKSVKVDPFVTGGYSLLFRAGHANLFNLGGGFNYWFLRHVGARVEMRDQIYTPGSTLHYWGFRFGMAFRGRPD